MSCKLKNIVVFLRVLSDYIVLRNFGINTERFGEMKKMFIYNLLTTQTVLIKFNIHHYLDCSKSWKFTAKVQN